MTPAERAEQAAWGRFRRAIAALLAEAEGETDEDEGHSRIVSVELVDEPAPADPASVVSHGPIRLDRHPLLRECFDLMGLIEQLPASPLATDCSTAAGNLLQHLADELGPAPARGEVVGTGYLMLRNGPGGFQFVSLSYATPGPAMPQEIGSYPVTLIRGAP
jgi:hypothetical protein